MNGKNQMNGDLNREIINNYFSLNIKTFISLHKQSL